MLRFIIKRRFRDVYGLEFEGFETIDTDVPELERVLLSGGVASDGSGYDISDLEGVEILQKQAPEGEGNATPRPVRVLRRDLQ